MENTALSFISWVISGKLLLSLGSSLVKEKKKKKKNNKTNLGGLTGLAPLIKQPMLVPFEILFVLCSIYHMDLVSKERLWNVMMEWWPSTSVGTVHIDLYTPQTETQYLDTCEQRQHSHRMLVVKDRKPGMPWSWRYRESDISE